MASRLLARVITTAARCVSATGPAATRATGFGRQTPLLRASVVNIQQVRHFADHKEELEVYTGSCHCGTCEFEVDGPPNVVYAPPNDACICPCVAIAVQVVCHCSICRRCHSAPCAELAAYDNDRVRITKGAEELHMYNVFGESKEDRYFCTECGSKVLSVLNHLGSKAVHLQNMTHPNHGADGKISDPRFRPSLHIYYGSGTTNVFDGLPKYKTMPAALGGNDETLPEDFH